MDINWLKLTQQRRFEKAGGCQEDSAQREGVDMINGC